MPKRPTVEERLPQEARERLALLELDAIREAARGDDWGQDAPDEWWHLVPALLGMPVEQDVERPHQMPWMTWSIALLISVVSVMAFSACICDVLDVGCDAILRGMGTAYRIQQCIVAGAPGGCWRWHYILGSDSEGIAATVVSLQWIMERQYSCTNVC